MTLSRSFSCRLVHVLCILQRTIALTGPLSKPVPCCNSEERLPCCLDPILGTCETQQYPSRKEWHARLQTTGPKALHGAFKVNPRAGPYGGRPVLLAPGISYEYDCYSSELRTGLQVQNSHQEPSATLGVLSPTRCYELSRFGADSKNRPDYWALCEPTMLLSG